MRFCWRGPCFRTSGYAKAGRGLLLALLQLGVEIKVFPTDKKMEKPLITGFEELSKPQAQKEIKTKITVFHDLPTKFNPLNKWNVGLTYWETSRLPPDWVRNCNKMNHLILFSEHNREIFEQSGVMVPIDVIPSGVLNSIETDQSFQISQRFLPIGSEPGSQENNVFTFLTVSQWIPRKGFDVLLRAYCEEFSPEDDVLLVIKTRRSKSKNASQIYREILDQKNNILGTFQGPRILLYVGKLADSEMDLLYQSSDAFVLPTRGEGVGLPYLEAGRAGLPVIATGWGGQMDFLNEENSFLIQYSLSPARKSPCSPYYDDGQLWADPDINHLKYLLRLVYENRKKAKEKANLLKSKVLQEYTWERAASLFIEKLNDRLGGC